MSQRYAISDRNLADRHGFALPVEQARQLALEGIEFYQLREKDLSAAALAELARRVLNALAGTATRLLINGRADVAAAVGAHGVQLTSSRDELTAQEVHQVYAAAGRPAPLVIVSCHSMEDVRRVHRDPLTAILFGPIFDKTVAGERVSDGSGLAQLEDVCRLAGAVPVFSLGGVTEENTAACLEAGARGIAGIRLFQRSKKEHPREAVSLR